MSSVAKLSVVLLIAFGISTIYGHPAYQHHFNKIVDSNPCLKQCMGQVTTENVELSLLKTANISDFLINVRQICSLISTTRECIYKCQIDSNPFALESMTAICSDESLVDAHAVRGCLTHEGSRVFDQCTETCGNYNELNDEVHQKTKEFQPESNDPAKTEEVMRKVNDACGALKCSNRCSVRIFSERCGRLNDGRDAGEVLRKMIERVLMGQRRDLEKQQLTETLAQSVPIQCNYMYMPEVMFNAEKDQLALTIIDQSMKREQDTMKPQRITRQRTAAENVLPPHKKELSLTLSQIQSHLIQKQLNVLEMQERNLRKEARKLDIELALLSALKGGNTVVDGNAYQPKQLE